MVSERIFLPIVHLECMLLIIQHFKSYLISFGSVIAQLDWSPLATRRGEAIQKKELDYPVKRLCRNVILRLQPKNLSLIRHRFNEILHFVQNDNIPFQGNCDTVSKPWNDNNVVLLMNFLVNPSITTINDYLSVIARSLRAVAISYSKKKDCFAFT